MNELLIPILTALLIGYLIGRGFPRESHIRMYYYLGRIDEHGNKPDRFEG